MTKNPELLRALARLTLGAAWVLITVAVAVYAVAVLRPEISLERLYRGTSVVERFMLPCVFGALVGLLLLDALARRGGFQEAYHSTRKRSIRYLQVPGALVFMFLVWAFIPTWTLVRQSGDTWLSVGRAGTSEISQTVARKYLWHSAAFHALIVVGIGVILAFSSATLLRAIRSSQEDSS